MFCGEKSLSIGVKNSIKNLVVIEIVRTFAPLSKGNRALSSAGSERLPYKQRVGGSNPSAPTFIQDYLKRVVFFLATNEL